MNSVERVRAICKERKIPISRLEKDLSFGNGYIGQLRKGIFPADRLAAIADYLNVSIEYLMSGETKNALTSEGERTETERKLTVLARHLDSIPEETRNRLIHNFSETIDMYLDAMGIPKDGE